MKRELTILLACFFVISCARLGSESTDNPNKDECPGTELVCIRVENTSDISFDSFEVNFSGQQIQYGSLGVGQISDYRRVDATYSYAFTEAFSDERRFILQPIDFVGEKHLPPGNYTYRYTANVLEEPEVQGDWILHGFMGVRLTRDVSSQGELEGDNK